jgi:flavin-dependent dehydrogenase
MYDLIAVGGGPAGSAAAITAASNGARVLLLEKGRFPRQKVCGEFVSAESLEVLRALLTRGDGEVLLSALSVSETRIFVDGHTLRATIDPPAASIARFDLDLALWQSAASHSVETRQQVTVSTISGNDPFCVATSAGNFESRALINASGRWSNLNPAIGGQPSEKWLGIKAHFAETSLASSVDLYFFPGGYCGVQPLVLTNEAPPRRRINACAMVRADIANNLEQVFELHPALNDRSSSWRPLMEPVSTSPLIFRKPQPLREAILMVGDAAGFVDPFVGDGISLALRSGVMAAQALWPFFRGESSLEQSAALYRTEYEKKLAPVFRASSRVRNLLTIPLSLRAPVFFFLDKAPAVTRYLIRKTR